MREAQIIISSDATLSEVLPTLYEFVQIRVEFVEHYAPNATLSDVVTRETLLNLINALNRLIALPPAIEKGSLERLRDLECSPNSNN